MDATTTTQRTSGLPLPPPRPPIPGTRTDPAQPNGPGWVPVAATVVAQIVWLVAVFYAWVVAIVIIGFGTGADSVEAWMVLSSVGALALAPVPTVAFVLSRRNR